MRVWLLGLIVLAAPASAAAQLGYVVHDAGGGGYECVGSIFATCAGSGASCADASHVCHGLPGGSGRCAPADVLWCDAEGGTMSECPAGLAYQRVLDLDVCVPEDAVLCGADIAFCFTSTNGTGTSMEPLAYDFGDCDRDGLRNADDPHPCTRAPAIGLVDPATGGCDPLVTRVCASDADCSPDRPVCAEVSTAPESYRYCVAADPPALCCGGFTGTECGNGATCDAVGPDAIGLCHPFCGDEGWTFEMRLGCLRDPDDASRFVGPGAGDCDGDGMVNAEEARTDGRDPCVAEDGGVPMTPDGGALEEDAGMLDAGTGAQEDAGTTPMDASSTPPPVSPSFEGGGGCRCRASASSSSGAPWWLAVGALALWRRRRHPA